MLCHTDSFIAIMEAIVSLRVSMYLYVLLYL